MSEHSPFYAKVLENLVRSGAIDRSMTVLVVCGGDTDKTVLQHLGFEHVTITNVDESGEDDRYSPFAWTYADAEALPFDDESFDVAIVNAGLHHCHSPHRGLLELYRVSRAVAVCIEARDSLTMRLASRLGLTDDYEVSAVAYHGLRAGGVRNSSTPNYVYRWTEREVEKTVSSYAPAFRHQVTFMHELELPAARADLQRSKRLGRLLRLAAPIAQAIVRLAPRQANQLAFAVRKPRVPGDLQPWMTVEGSRVIPDGHAVAARYDLGG